MRHDRQGNRNQPNRHPNDRRGGGGNNPNRSNRDGGNRGGGGRPHNRHRRDRDDDDQSDLDRPGRLSPYQQSIDRIQVPPKEKKPLKQYGVIFFDTMALAKAGLAEIEAKAKEVEQLNIVIRAESNMEDPELTQLGKVFAGAAWALIHDRRVTDGWYNQPQE